MLLILKTRQRLPKQNRENLRESQVLRGLIKTRQSVEDRYLLYEFPVKNEDRQFKPFE